MFDAARARASRRDAARPAAGTPDSMTSHDVALGDAASDAAALQAGDLDAVLGGDLPYERRGFRSKRVPRTSRRCRRRVGRRRRCERVRLRSMNAKAAAIWRRFAFRGGPPSRCRAATPLAAATAATAPASVSMRATTVCTGTVCPSVTSTSANTPDVGDGISASTLSVEISKIGSSRFTASPTFFSQRDIVPSAIDSPIWGITTSIRATGSTSRDMVAPNVTAAEPRQHQQRERHRATTAPVAA